MTPAQLQTIEEIFYAALGQEPDQVARFLDSACEGDELLRRKVEALLASRQRIGNFIESSAAGIATRIIENEQADLLMDVFGKNPHRIRRRSLYYARAIGTDPRFADIIIEQTLNARNM